MKGDTGKQILFEKSTGRKLELFPVDAREALASGNYVASLEVKKPTKPAPVEVTTKAEETFEAAPPEEKEDKKPKKLTSRKTKYNKK